MSQMMSRVSILCFGNPRVGKICFMRRVKDNTFSGEFDSAIEDPVEVTRHIGDQDISVSIARMTTPDYEALMKMQIKNSDGWVFVYSVTDRQSFDAIESLWNEVTGTRGSSIPSILCGNKCDMDNDRQVSTEEGQLLAKRLNVQFFETSAQNPTNVEEAFMYLVNEVLSMKPPEKKKSKNKRCSVA